MNEWHFPTTQELGIWLATVAAACLTAFKVWRAKSDARLKNTKDTTEAAGLQYVVAQMQAQVNEAREQVTEARAERDTYKREAREAWVQQRRDAAEISGLRADALQMAQQIRALTDQVTQLQSIIARHLPLDGRAKPRKDV